MQRQRELEAQREQERKRQEEMKEQARKYASLSTLTLCEREKMREKMSGSKTCDG